MAMTSANVTSLTRSLLQEASAKFWDDDEITLYIQAAMIVIQGHFYTFLYEEKKTFTTQTKTASTATFTVPTDTFKIVGVEVAETGRRLRYISDNEYFKYAQWDEGDPVAWMFKAGDIMVIPTPSSTEANYWRVWYLPNMNSVTEFPDDLRPLIAVEAAILGRAKDDNITPGLLMLQKSYNNAAMKSLTLAQMQEPVIIGDYELEDSHTDSYVD